MRFDIVVIGASAGGLKALHFLLSRLSPDFGLPIIVVQHRGKDFDPGLCEFLSRHSRLPILEPNDKDPIVAGYVYLAPRDYHLLIEETSFALSIDEPLGFARPSIDATFESVADEYGDRVIGVILTGAGSDGARGLAKIKERGGLTIVQHPAEAAHAELPNAALRVGSADWIVQLQDIPSLLMDLSKPPVELYAS